MKKISGSGKDLKVRIEKGQLIISIGIDTLAFAFDNGEYAYELFKVSNIKGFAKDVLYELLREEEDGTTPVHRLLDEVCNEAAEQGSRYVRELGGGGEEDEVEDW